MPDCSFRVHANNLANLATGVVGRLFEYPPGNVLSGHIERAQTDRLRPFLEDLRPFHVRQLSNDAFLEGYHGRKRTQYALALESLKYRPLDFERDSRVAAFIKAEKFDFKAKPSATPRIIQPRSYRFLAEAGKFLRPMEGPIYKAMGRLYKYPCVAKGFNALETAKLIRDKWNLFRDPVAVTLDASRFDMHVSVEMLEFTHEVYRMFNRDPYFMDLMKCCLRNTGAARCPSHRIRYTLEGRRMSGDMDTALGNCIIMVAMTYCFMRGIPHEVVDNGDDCMIICERTDVPSHDRIKEWYGNFGFVIKVENVSDVFERIEFCQTRPVWTEKGYVMCRLISSLAKDACSINAAMPIEYWLYGIGEAGLALADGLPIFPQFYEMLCRLGRKSKVARSVSWQSGMIQLCKGMSYEGTPVTERVRHSFFLAFGIDADRQRAIEALYPKVPGLGKRCRHIEGEREYADLFRDGE